MRIELRTPTVDELSGVVRALRSWQHTEAPMQLHPGDLGWAWKLGAAALAASVRTWNTSGRVVAVGLVDSPTVLRLTAAPDDLRDEALAQQVIADVTRPDRGVLPAGRVSVEAPNGSRIQDLLDETGWQVDEPWTPLRRELAAPTEDPGVRIKVVGAERAARSIAVHRSAFSASQLDQERWHTMTGGPPYADARSLLALDEAGVAVAEVTVWSAGAGRPGLLEPMGVHADHRGRGYGRAICVAAAAALRDMGASSALVCTPSANVGAVATYTSAGFASLPQRYDRARTT